MLEASKPVLHSLVGADTDCHKMQGTEADLSAQGAQRMVRDIEDAGRVARTPLLATGVFAGGTQQSQGNSPWEGLSLDLEAIGQVPSPSG